MKLHMTDGSSRITFGISHEVDPEEYARVAKSKRPVSTAISVVKRRIGAERISGLYPVPGKALEGIEAATQEYKMTA